jgi:hypothetical protein
MKFTATMLSFLGICCSSAIYPLLLGVPRDVSAPAPESLALPGILPENLTIFIAVGTPDSPIATLQQLSAWSWAAEVCERVGKTLAFPRADSQTFNFLPAIRALYPSELAIDTQIECLCKVRHFRGGLMWQSVFPSAKSNPSRFWRRDCHRRWRTHSLGQQTD